MPSYDRDLPEDFRHRDGDDDLATAEVISTEPKTKADRIRLYAAQHPDEGPTKIAAALGGGIKPSYVSGVLSERPPVVRPLTGSGRLLPLINEAAEIAGGLRELHELIGVLMK